MILEDPTALEPTMGKTGNARSTEQVRSDIRAEDARSLIAIRGARPSTPRPPSPRQDREIRRVLPSGGRPFILQPNIRYTGEIRARFLSYTTKSGLPPHPALVWLDLKLPIAQRLLGQQSWIVAARDANGGL